MEHDDYFGAVYAAIGVGSAPEGYAASDAARAGVEKLRGYLRARPPPDLHHRTMLLWASLKLEGLLDAAGREQAVAALLAAQKPDGGWSIPALADWKRHDGTPNPKDGPSDGYGTGLAVLVLRLAGLDAGREELRRGAAWLRSQQRASGRWFTRSPSKDDRHYITHAGTAYAAMALAACGEPKD
jgi:squalene-hopene/tetraprenyl-beta-curcumene cyclase